MRRTRRQKRKADHHARITDTVSIRAPGLGRRLDRARFLGTRLVIRQLQQLDRNPRRTSDALRVLAKIDSNDIETVINALMQHAHSLPRELYPSLTCDRGKEMVKHQRFMLGTEFRCTSLIRRSRGSLAQTRTPTDSRDSTSRRVRICRFTCMRTSMQRPGGLNERPSETRIYEIPAERFAQCVATVSGIRSRERTLPKVPRRRLNGDELDVGS